jgi:serine/threonine-protein kinase
MAPEQLAGAAADARGDLYSLGVLLFELFTGRLPHHGSSFGEFLRQVAGEAAPDLRLFVPQADAGAAQIVARLLHKQPGSRPADAHSAAAALAAARAAAAVAPGAAAMHSRETR